MNTLPIELENIIIDYKYQLEIKERKQKLHLELFKKMESRDIIYHRVSHYSYYDEVNDTFHNNTIFNSSVYSPNGTAHLDLDYPCELLLIERGILNGIGQILEVDGSVECDKF